MSRYAPDVIRPEETYRSRSYNRARQVLSFVDHLYVRYPVPLFLYRSVLSFEGLKLVFDERAENRAKGGYAPAESKYRPWFHAVARGESFAKASRDVFTKREAHWFLKAPSCNGIEKNIFWAKAAAAGVPPAGCDYLVERFGASDLKRIGDRLPDLLRFYANAWAEMRGDDHDEITDFIRAAVQNQEFSLKGRTFGSMRKLCHEWHRTVYSVNLREYRSWSPLYSQWEHRKPGRAAIAVELTNNHALADEGKTQRHCVYSYTMRCMQGLSRIVSIRWFTVASRNEVPKFEVDRLTLEISPAHRLVVQIRGRLNRRATEEEMEIVRAWAGKHGLVISVMAG